MKRYTQDRYIPYFRTRYRTRARRNIPNNFFIRDIAVLLRFIVCIALLAVTLNGVGENFYLAVENISEYKSAQLINEYIDGGVLYATNLFDGKNFVSASYNRDGEITSIETDAIEVNRFASTLSESIHSEIKRKEHDTIKVPIGSVTGKNLLSSLGLSIPYRIVPAGKVMVTTESVFKNAGINQTIHQLKMKICVNVRILFPLIKNEEEITRDIIVSETVIIGDVPEMLLTKSQ